MATKIYRSGVERKIAGVCGGLGEYFNVDPTLMRIIFLTLVLAGGSGVIAYLLAWLLIPEAPTTSD